ncbi:hypothetical protein M885DRAFT_540136 [Pelagophyceae sp. CCMP2097]|nr:hypothetical protein M885DRAFT_540136 [Pelagophyceae sp. CCMP2097]
MLRALLALAQLCVAGGLASCTARRPLEAAVARVESSQVESPPTHSAALTAELRRNDAQHARDVAASVGAWGAVAGGASVPRVSRVLRSAGVSAGAPVCVSSGAVPRHVCASIIAEAEARWAATAGNSEFTMTDFVRDVHTHDLPDTKTYLQKELLPQMLALAASKYIAKDLVLYDSLVIRYDASLGFASQPVHRDYSFLSFNLALNDSGDYAGGGTFFEDGLSEDDAPAFVLKLEDQGDVVMHPSRLRHAGAATTRGLRYVLVGFLTRTKLDDDAEHSRVLHQRALAARQKGDAGAALDLCLAGLELDPEDAELQLQAALCISALADARGEASALDGDALRHAEDAARLMPRSVSAWNQLGLCRLRAAKSRADAERGKNAFELAEGLVTGGRGDAELAPEELRAAMFLRSNADLAESVRSGLPAMPPR